MDPVSHVILGRALIGFDRRGRFGAGAVAAAVLGAIAPDIDALAIWRGWDVYLRVHQIGTHSIPGSLVTAWAAATLVFLLKRGSRYAALILAASVGALSHVVFDLVSGASIRLGWPFLQGRARLPLVAMADPWLIAICALGAGALWALRRPAFTVATAVVAATGAFLTLKGLLMAAAVLQWRAATSADTIVHHAADASWSSLTEWNISDRTPHALRKWRVDAVGIPALSFSIPLGADSPLVEASRSFDTVRNFLGVHDLGFAVTTPVEHGTQVLWSDLRYCWSGTECALWFGGTFDREGRPVMQIVRVGAWLQTRPVEP